MNLFGLTICRNEEWSLPASARAALRYCDALVILDHSSIDNTPAVIDELEYEYPGRIFRLEEHDPDWKEMPHRQRTLDKARAEGATHCAIIDADEILSENYVPQIRELIADCLPGQVLQIPWLTCWRSLDKIRCDGHPLGRAMVSIGFPDHPDLHWRASDNGYQFHHRHPYGTTYRRVGQHIDGGLFHLQHASWRRVMAKQRWYQMQETVLYGAIKANYAGSVDESGLVTLPVPAEWWGPERKYLNVDAVPWQEADCERMIGKHGAEKFSGCSLLLR